MINKYKNLISYSKHCIDFKDIKSVTKILNSKNLTKGNVTKKFEKKIKNFCKSKHALTTINASCSLLMACKALDLKKKDIVWTTNITYVASINCALHLNAKIDLIDIENQNYNLCLNEFKKKLVLAKKKNCLPKIVVVVHLGGYPAPLKEIFLLSKKYNFKIIEDASHAFGALYQNNKIGNCRFSDLTVFSFHPVKNITTAEGGAITTNNNKLYSKLLMIRENGQTAEGISQNKYPTKYDVKLLGYNFRINEINSSLGLSQIIKTNKFIKIKREIAKRYFRSLDIEQIKLPSKDILKKSSLHLFIIKINFNSLKLNKFEFLKKMRKLNIYLNTHYIPLSNLSLIKKNIKKGKNIYKNSQSYYNNALSLPMFPGLKFKDQTFVIKSILNLIKKNLKKNV